MHKLAMMGKNGVRLQMFCKGSPGGYQEMFHTNVQKTSRKFYKKMFPEHSHLTLS